MPIDTSKEPDFAYKFSRRWTIDGHEVALGQLRYLKRKGDAWSSPHVLCECDFDFTIEVLGGQKCRVTNIDAHDCQAKEKVRQSVIKESRETHGKAWKKMGLEAAILDIHRRVKKKEWLGQRTPELIYVQEAAEVLGEDPKKVWQACDSLYAQEKLDLNGAIFADHVRRFRLPREMAAVIFRVVGDPLGYPNGDAGDGAVYDFEQRLQKRLRCASGRKAFGSANWPRIDPRIVADHALDWLSATLARASTEPAHRERLRKVRRRDIEKNLERLKETHPEIRTDVFAEYVRELVRLAWERMGLYEAYAKAASDKGERLPSKKEIEAATLKEMAEEYGAWAKAFRAPKKK